jgi:hypothetical protein
MIQSEVTLNNYRGYLRWPLYLNSVNLQYIWQLSFKFPLSFLTDYRTCLSLSPSYLSYPTTSKAKKAISLDTKNSSKS